MPISIYGAGNPDLKKFNIQGEAVIWRYMNLGKFLDIITKGQIWFTRAIELRKTDPYEGALTTSDHQKLSRVLTAKDKDELRALWPAIGNFMDDAPGMSLPYFQMIFLTRVPAVEMNAYTASISCWHENPSESDAMWALYAQRDAGIAIKSTVDRVLNAFASSKRNITIAKVNYDSEGSLSAMTSGIYDSLLIKRHAFHHENEVRIITLTLDGYEAPEWTEENQRYYVDQLKSVPLGVYIDCDIQTLIEEIIVSPLMPTYAYEAIENIGKAYIPTIPVRRSTLLSKKDDIPWESLSLDLKTIWNHFHRTKHLLDVDELSLSPEELEARRSQKIRTGGS
jgi:hypothetical protein